MGALNPKEWWIAMNKSRWMGKIAFGVGLAVFMIASIPVRAAEPMPNELRPSETKGPFYNYSENELRGRKLARGLARNTAPFATSSAVAMRPVLFFDKASLNRSGMFFSIIGHTPPSK